MCYARRCPTCGRLLTCTEHCEHDDLDDDKDLESNLSDVPGPILTPHPTIAPRDRRN